MTLAQRITAAARAFRRPPPVQWVVAELSVAWRIRYFASSQAKAEQWVIDDAPHRPADRFITVQPLATIRQWNTTIVESQAFWDDWLRLHRMIDSARTDALIDKAGIIGSLSHPSDTMEVTDQKDPTDD